MIVGLGLLAGASFTAMRTHLGEPDEGERWRRAPISPAEAPPCCSQPPSGLWAAQPRPGQQSPWEPQLTESWVSPAANQLVLRFLSKMSAYCCMPLMFCDCLLHSFILTIDNWCQKVTCHVLYVTFPKRLVGIVKQEGRWHLHSTFIRWCIAVYLFPVR